MDSPRSKAWEEFGDVSLIATTQLVRAWHLLKASGALDAMEVDELNPKEMYPDPQLCSACGSCMVSPANASPVAVKADPVSPPPAPCKLERGLSCLDEFLSESSQEPDMDNLDARAAHAIGLCVSLLGDGHSQDAPDCACDEASEPYQGGSVLCEPWTSSSYGSSEEAE